MGLKEKQQLTLTRNQPHSFSENFNPCHAAIDKVQNILHCVVSLSSLFLLHVFIDSYFLNPAHRSNIYKLYI